MKNYNDLNDYQNYTNDPYAAMTEPKAKKSGAGKIVAIALCCSLLGGAAGAGGMVLASKSSNSASSASVSVQTDRETVRSETAGTDKAAAGSDSKNDGATTLISGSHGESAADSSSQVSVTKAVADTSKKMTASEVYKANVNSTVGIRTSITSTNYWGYQTQAAASGSGFIISTDGYIITNHHVIEDADSITVSLYDGREFPAKLIGSDESNDVAVLKVEADGLTPVVLGSSGALEVGEDVVAIGNPLGELTFSLTAGIVSALDRTITTQSTTMDLIQTDCAINAGNSGGALFNMYGEVVGITNSKYSRNGMSEASIDNIGFAIPMDNIRGIIDSLIKDGYVMQPYIGVSLADLSRDAINYGIPQGAAVSRVTEGAPAESAGVQVGDIITKADGTDITCKSQFIAFLKKYKAGDQIKLTLYRKGETLEKTVTISEKKQQTEEEKQAEKKKQQERLQQEYEDFYSIPGFGSIFGY